MQSQPIIPAQEVVEYLNSVDSYRQNNPGIRQGQAYMNVLYEKYPEIYNYVSGKDFDPFYDDSRIQKFLIEIF